MRPRVVARVVVLKFGCLGEPAGFNIRQRRRQIEKRDQGERIKRKEGEKFGKGEVATIAECVLNERG